ncbi:MAG: hypothetical protein ACJAYJ_004455 [Saprospiraceae bacterium]|jgi:hypothetical protein
MINTQPFSINLQSYQTSLTFTFSKKGMVRFVYQQIMVILKITMI